MIRIDFTQEQIKSLQHERFHHPHPQVQRKMEAVYLKSQGIRHKEICRLTGICAMTLCTYLHEYKDGGIEKLKELNSYKPQSELMTHRQSIEEYFRTHPPATVKEAMAKIEAVTGIKRSPTQIRGFMNAIGLKRRKVCSIPAKADLQKQEEFKRNELEPRLEEARTGKRVVFFVDAAHFVLHAFLGFLWCFLRVFIRAPAGRQRFNVLGALNAVTHKIITVTNETYITAESVCQLLRKISALGITVPITLVLDNARYQHCALVQQLAESLHIELLFLPSYSPNLNLIERFWKFVKKQCLYSTYYDNFTRFKYAIEQCISHAHTYHKQELDSLLVHRFQTLQNSNL
jgi:transposase